MMRAALAALGFALILLWLVGVVDGATVWMTWLDGMAAVLTFWLLPVTRPDLSPVRAAAGPALIGTLLLAVFAAGVVTKASGWLTWFTLAFAGGYLMFAGFAFLARTFEPAVESRRPFTEM